MSMSWTNPDPERLTGLALDLALDAGADGAEIYYERSQISRIQVENGKVEGSVAGREEGIALRILVGQHLGFFATTELGANDLESFVSEAIARTRRLAPVEHAALPAGNPVPDASLLDLVDPALSQATIDEKKSLVIAEESAARRADPQSATTLFTYEDRLRFMQLASTGGARVSYESGTASISGTVSDGATRITGRRAARHLADVAGPSLGHLLGGRMRDLHGGHPPREETMTVIFPPDLAAVIVATIARAALVGYDSPLASKLGERIGTELWNLVDDGTFPGGLASAPADDEGVASAYRHPLVNGRLAGLLHTYQSAARMGLPPTGNARRASFRSPPAAAHRNLILTPGHQTPEEILSGIDRGLYVEAMNGAGEPSGGRFSAAIAGHVVERGHRTRAVAGARLESSIEEVLGTLVAVGHDLEWWGEIATPTLVFEKMRISGDR